MKDQHGVRTDGGRRRGRANEIDRELWGGDCIRCRWSIRGAGTREQVVEQSRAHREQAAREGDMRGSHKVVVQNPDGDPNGLALNLMTPYVFRELDRYEEGCERNGCENEGVFEVTTPTAMEQTDWDKPSSGSTVRLDEINAICEECAGEYDNNLQLKEGPSSLNGFLESEK